MDDVPQVLNLRLQENTLGGFKLQTGTSESFENLPQTTDVHLEVWGAHNCVIEVDQQCLSVDPTEDLFYESLEGGRAEVNPKGSTFHFHSPPLV